MISFVDFLARWLKVTLEPAQRVYWSVAGDGRDPVDLETDEERELAAALFGDIDTIPEGARSVVALVKGADVGASFIGGLRLLYRAITADVSDAAPGEVRPALCVAPDLRTARIPVGVARAFAERVPKIARMIVRAGPDRVVFRREGGRFTSVECLPATVGGKATRGRRYLEVLLDEAAFFRDESTGQVNDAHVFQSVVVRCVGKVWLSSTPWLETNLIWKLFEENHGKPSTAVAARMPTLLVRTNKRTRDMVAREMERDPELAAQEYACEPLGAGAAQFFGAKDLEDALDRDLPALPSPSAGARVLVAADLGLVRDATACVAVYAQAGQLVLADALEFRPKRGMPLKLSEVMPKICAFAERHGTQIVRSDHHLLSEARQHMIPGFSLKPVVGGQDAKAARYVRARTALKEGRVRIPGAFARVIAQLGDVTAKVQPGGGVSIQHARRRGMHGDLAAALVVALGEQDKPRSRMLVALTSKGGEAERRRLLREAAGLPPEAS